MKRTKWKAYLSTQDWKNKKTFTFIVSSDWLIRKANLEKLAEHTAIVIKQKYPEKYRNYGIDYVEEVIQ